MIYLERVGNIIGGYRVKDGICYVKLTATSTGGVTGNKVIFTNMPKSKNGEVSVGDGFIINNKNQLISNENISSGTVFEINGSYETTSPDMPYIVE